MMEVLYRGVIWLIWLGFEDKDAGKSILHSVLLFCPDMLDLVERNKVEEYQLKFATLLQKYLRFKLVLCECYLEDRFDIFWDEIGLCG